MGFTIKDLVFVEPAIGSYQPGLSSGRRWIKKIKILLTVFEENPTK